MGDILLIELNINKNLPKKMKKVKFGLSRTKESTIVEFVCALMFILVVILDIIILRRGTESFMDFFARTIVSFIYVFIMLENAYCSEIPENADMSKIPFYVRCCRILAVFVSLLTLVWVVTVFLGLTRFKMSAIVGLVATATILWNMWAFRRLRKKN